MDGPHVWRLGMEASGSLYLLCVSKVAVNLPRTQDIISNDPATHGSMMVPLLLGSDKTLASNATGQNEFHPLYFSPGNVKNSVRRAHCDALVPIGFLAIPKSISAVPIIRPHPHIISRHAKGRNKSIVPAVSTTTVARIAKDHP